MSAEKKYLDSAGLATLIGKIKVGIENAIKNIPNATTSAYGLTKLSSAIDSDAENLAATPKAVKAIKTALDTMSDVVADKADKTALNNYVPLVGNSTIDGNLEVTQALEAVMVQSNDIVGHVNDSSGNGYGTNVLCTPDIAEISASTSKGNGVDLNNSAGLNVSTNGADIFTSSYARNGNGGNGTIYTASMYTSPNSAQIHVDDEDKETRITPNSLQIMDYGANPQTYIDINVDGITAPKLSVIDGTNTQFLMADGSVKEANTVEDNRYSQFVDILYDSNYCPIIPSEAFFGCATWMDMPEDNKAALDFCNEDAKTLYYNGEEWVEAGMAATALYIPYANNTTSGLMSAADKTKLDALETAVDALSSATHFIGISSTEISDGNTQKPTINNTSITKLQKGDIVIYGNKEFIWDGTKWVELGDITALAQKVTAIEEALETNKNGALSDTEVGTIFDNAWK